MKYPKQYTVKEWNKFNQIADYTPDDPNTGRPYQFFNYLTQRLESYDYMTAQEVLLHKYDIILTGYKVNPLVNYKDLSKKELAVKIAKNFNMTNFNKGMKIFNQGVKGFTDSIDAVTSQLGDGKNNDIEKHIERVNKQGKIWSNKKEGIKVWSAKKPSRKNKVKIWSDPPKKKKSRKRHSVQSKSSEWDKHERNLEKLWGKRK